MDTSDRYSRLLQSAYMARLVYHEGGSPMPTRKFFEFTHIGLREMIARRAAATWRQSPEWEQFVDLMRKRGIIDYAPLVLATVDRFSREEYQDDWLLTALEVIAEDTGSLLEACILVAVITDADTFRRENA